MLKEKIRELAQSYATEFTGVRRHLHAHPELSYQEFETSKFICSKLTEWDIPFQVMATTGVAALIEGKKPGSRCIALRADMDALPIPEQNNVPYRSTREGVMHACGHDVHTTCLLGAAKIVSELREEIEGTIKLVFQPGEEKNPGGASLMIRDGVLTNPAPQAIIALHVNPALDAGKLSFRKGRVMASADEIYITIRGKGGHAAAPHLTIDTILVAAQLVTSLQQVISRNNNPLSPSVLSICSIQGGHTTNVIPSEVKMMGTFRAMDEGWRRKAHDIIRQHATGMAHALGAEIDLHIDVGYPCVDNDEQLTGQAWKLAEEFLGAGNVEETEIRMGAEDFGYYTQEIPGCFFRLGVRNERRGIVHNVHTPLFDIDESAIETGMGTMAWLAATVRP
ncbi:MAG TPA: M20 family metallopeptidase [Chitinophagaceae bacterium]